MKKLEKIYEFWEKLEKRPLDQLARAILHFYPFSREPEFSRIWGFRKMLDNSKTLRFTKFLAKTNHSILRTSPKALYKKSEEYN